MDERSSSDQGQAPIGQSWPYRNHHQMPKAFEGNGHKWHVIKLKCLEINESLRLIHQILIKLKWKIQE
ncbi:CLUMA_CG016105, isoform A [Clunio marinus]|uniref:CLUMA_CG016105, isoform A n=1 Tax=Clunio marinus TaxID=568069 RepID=A0A1J1IRV9_9DIPT|nr:CLUMA_CG016105, isoform A [Clunio marinus]